MKLWTAIFLLIWVTSNSAIAQEKQFTIFDEFLISVNQTNVADDNTENRVGFGLGAYHTFRPQKKMNLIVGVEINQTNQFKKRTHEGHFAVATDITYKRLGLAIPLGFRVNIGTKTKFFIEAGGFVDAILINANAGTRTTTLPNGPNPSIPEEQEFSGGGNSWGNTVGVYTGFGICIPISKIDLIVKPEYKLGIPNDLGYANQALRNLYYKLNIGIRLK